MNVLFVKSRTKKPDLHGKSELLDGSKVCIQGIARRACWIFDSLKEEQFQESLGRRTAESSSVHDQSLRMHAILELGIIKGQLIEAKEEELIPVGKQATDTSIEEQSKPVTLSADGTWIHNSNYQIDQERVYQV
ncbi:hypothetical protein BELL_0596g00050 [Botrytis elliptica]|uniref:Uncharacterized protein n=1 Tax=Botrytis elliptica TaxID=278938 RepID=A0A4Z1JDH7_9HELO|nr:hypothetical protein BELL_0596g00050 [Botrytis elliptica]